MPLRTGLFNIGLVKVLLVRVSVVALPINVSVDVGKVSVPVLDTELITGLVKVLLVSVCVPVKVATVLSIANVTELPEAVEVMPVPPIRDNVSVFRLIVIPVTPSETFKLMAPSADMSWKVEPSQYCNVVVVVLYII